MRAGAIQLIVTALLASTGLASQARAQALAPMKHPLPDDNGVDVIYGIPWIESGHLTIGQPSQGGLEFYRIWQGGGATNNWSGGVTKNGSSFTVKVGFSIETFTLVSGVYNSDDGMGSTLTFSNALFTYTTSDGTVVKFQTPGATDNSNGRLFTITRPNGLKINFWDTTQQFCEMVGTRCDTSPETLTRLQTVTTNTGYMLKFIYALGSSSTPKRIIDEDAWQRLATVLAVNNSVDYCSVTADDCGTLPHAWPSATITQSTSLNVFTDVWADALAHKTTSTVTSGALTSIQSPADPSVDFTMTYDASGRVATFARGGGTWGYTYSDVGTQRTTTVTQPGGGSKVYVSDTSNRKLISVTDELGHTTAYTYDSFLRPTRVTQPEGNYVEVTYDSRGNITQRKSVAKSGSGLADILRSASYDSTCLNPKTCNEPNNTVDARGYTTDYTYDPNHGGVLSATQPAPTTGAVRPQLRYSYSTRQAYYKSASGGSPTASGQPIYLLTTTSECQTLASCTGTADEVKTTTDYGPQIAGSANNLLPVSTSKGSGDGALTAITTNSYDIFGNLTSVDGPLPGTADTSGFRYDANRQLTMRVSPDPDGAGPLKNRAQQITYNADGNVTRIEEGTTTSLTGPFTAAASGIRAEFTYDSLGRKVRQSLVSGSIGSPVIQTLTQYSYDTKGRLNCTALRMNSTAFGSLPADACTLGTQGSFGPDRITKIIFDNADEVAQSQVAVGTTDAANERTLTYTNNGKLQTLTDGENNKTTYLYDGFDRLTQTEFPNATKGSGASNPADYEQLTYDASSNVISRRLRDGSNLSFTFDNLNRAVFKDLPGSEPDVTYGFDNLGRMISASQTGNALSFTYDALGRKLTEAGPLGTVSSQFDTAGRRTVLSASGYYAGFQHLVTGELSAIRDSSGGSLATFGYDDLGNRTSLTFANATAQNYGYDPVSRLASLNFDFPGTSGDLTKTFAFNPASQIVSETRSNDIYANPRSNSSTATTSNGLNQQVIVGGVNASWDARGNLATDPQSAKTYSYSSENHLISSSGGVNLTFDPLGRLYEVAGGALGTRRFLYDGSAPIGELSSAGTVFDFYVNGESVDEPLILYNFEGGEVRRFLHADERGSIIAHSDDAGAVISINSYDEYGNPATPNIGRFQYTGQMWLSEIGAYYYKARMYLPHLGIFAQTDPVGYAGSPNLYAYVLSNPIKYVDPTGADIGCQTRIVALCESQDSGAGNTGSTGSSPSSGTSGGATLTFPDPNNLLPPLDPSLQECADTGVCFHLASINYGGLNGNGYIPQAMDYFLLGSTILGEAGEFPGVYAAVGWTIVNRVGDPRYANTLAGVVFQPHQFDAVVNPIFNEAYFDFGLKFDPIEERAFVRTQMVAIGILSGEVPDPTGGATHYFSGPPVTQWERQMRPTLRRDGYTFGP